MDILKMPEASVPALAARVWNMTGREWRAVIRASMRDRRALRFTTRVRVARLHRCLALGVYEATRDLPAEFQYDPNAPWLDLGGEGGGG